MLMNVSSCQVTIVTNNVPAVDGESGEARCQGDMEKADMVDGRQPAFTVYLFLFSFQSFKLLSYFYMQESKRVCAGHRLPRSTPTRPASTRRCARASRICSRYQVSVVPASLPRSPSRSDIT